MSTPIDTSLTIGGPVPQRLLPALCLALVQDRVCLEDEASSWDPTDGGRIGNAETLGQTLLVAARDGPLQIFRDGADYGEFPHLQPFLVAHGIAFNHHCLACGDQEGELALFRRGWEAPRMFLATNDGHLTVLASDLPPLVDVLSQASQSTDLAHIQRSLAEATAQIRLLAGLDIPTLTPLVITRRGPQH
jgi:hypothetical protein